MSEVPEQLRKDNWTLFVHARSSYDPAIKVHFTSELVGSLINTMEFIEERGYDEMLTECNNAAAVAQEMVADDKKKAALVCGNILIRIGHLLYNKKYATPQGDSFKFPIKGET